MKSKFILSTGLLMLATAFFTFLAVHQTATSAVSPEVITPGANGEVPTVTLSEDDAYNYASQYKTTAASKGLSSNGGIISRSALEAILANPNCNGISYRFCKDSTGTFAPGSALFIVVSGVNTTTNSRGEMTVQDLGIAKYTTRQWCPPSCMMFRVVNKATGQTELKD